MRTTPKRTDDQNASLNEIVVRLASCPSDQPDDHHIVIKQTPTDPAGQSSWCRKSLTRGQLDRHLQESAMVMTRLIGAPPHLHLSFPATWD